MRDIVGATASINTATLSALTVVSGDSLTVKSGAGPGRLVQAIGLGANLQYIKLTASDIPVGGIYLPGAVPGTAAHAAWNLPGGAIAEATPITVEAYQDSGGAENEYAFLVFSYNRGKVATRQAIAGKRFLVVRFTGTGVSGAWTACTTLNGNLLPDRQYAIVAAYVHAANAKAVRFDCADFGGMKPGGLATTDVGKVDVCDFGDEMPVFTGKTDCTPQIYTNGADATVGYVILAEL